MLMHSQVALSGATVSVHVKPGCQSTSVAVSKLTIIFSLISKQAFVKNITKLKCFRATSPGHCKCTRQCLVIRNDIYSQNTKTLAYFQKDNWKIGI